MWERLACRAAFSTWGLSVKRAGRDSDKRQVWTIKANLYKEKAGRKISSGSPGKYSGFLRNSSRDQQTQSWSRNCRNFTGLFSAQLPGKARKYQQ
jgi:hypothetical protein